MVHLKPLPEELQKVANEELGEVAARIPEDLQTLKAWIEQQPHIKARTDDQFLIQFLRGCKYSLERAKEKVDHFYALKSKCPDLFSPTDIDKAKFRKFHNTGSFIPLPTPLHGCGPRLLTLRFAFNPHEFNVNDCVQHLAAVNEVLLLNDPYACICGVVYIVDFDLATANHLMMITPSIIMKMVTFYEKTFPIRIKALCFINLSTIAEQFCKRIVLPYLNEKLRQRVVLCGKHLDDLNKHLPKKYLPRDYGGENGTLDQVTTEYNKVWDDNREYFQQNADYGTDERLRLGEPLDFDGDLGCAGTFRKLDVD